MTGFQEEDRDTQVTESPFSVPNPLLEQVKANGSVVLNTAALVDGKDVPNFVQERIFITYDANESPVLHSSVTHGGKSSEILDIAIDESKVVLTDRNPNGGKYEVHPNTSEVLLENALLAHSDPKRDFIFRRVENSVAALKSRLQKHFNEKEEVILTTQH